MESKEEPVPKLPKLSSENVDSPVLSTKQTCQHFVQRKKRLCRIMVAKGELYCGEHLPLTKTADPASNDDVKNGQKKRIPCPLDPKHTIFERNLQKHLRICNAKVDNHPEFIVPGLNAGPEDCEPENRDFRLVELDNNIINDVIEKVNRLYQQYDIDKRIEEHVLDHPLLADEIADDSRGHETLKHLTQTASMLGQLEHLKLLKDNTAYVEFGAGKGQVAVWLARAIEHMQNSQVLLIDRASLRHKLDNKMKETHDIHRIRADICDFDMRKLDKLQRARSIVATGKHLCGGATDLALRCMLHGNDNDRVDGKTEAFIIALCCYHRCTWQTFVGKEFFKEHNVSVHEFSIIAKMVGWAVCGTGMSRERRLLYAKEQGVGK